MAIRILILFLMFLSSVAARSQAQDFKFRMEQANQKVTALEGEVSLAVFFALMHLRS